MSPTCNHMHLCKREAERGGGNVKTSRQRSEDANLKTGAMQPDIIRPWKGQEQILPRASSGSVALPTP